jgi:hypothetical protein
MSSRCPPSGLHQSRREYWGNVYGDADSGNNNDNNNYADGDNNDVPTTDDSDDDGDEDNNNTDALVSPSAAAASLPPDIPVPHHAAATLLPLATIADVVYDPPLCWKFGIAMLTSCFVNVRRCITLILVCLILTEQQLQQQF